MAFKDIFALPKDFIELEEMYYNEEITEEELKLGYQNILDASEKDVESAINYLRYLNAEKETIEAEYKRIKAIKTKNAKSIDDMKNILSQVLEKVGTVGKDNKVRYKSATASMYFSKSSVVEITDENALAEKYKKVEQVTTISKETIKKDIASGLEVEGAKITENKNLQVR